jgi:hypothetical protein
MISSVALLQGSVVRVLPSIPVNPWNGSGSHSTRAPREDARSIQHVAAWVCVLHCYIMNKQKSAYQYTKKKMVYYSLSPSDLCSLWYIFYWLLPSLFYVCKENKVYHQKRSSATVVFVFRGLFYLHVCESYEIVPSYVLVWARPKHPSRRFFLFFFFNIFELLIQCLTSIKYPNGYLFNDLEQNWKSNLNVHSSVWCTVWHISVESSGFISPI